MRDERSVGSAVAVVGAILGVLMSVAGYLGFAGLTDVLAPHKRPVAAAVRPGGLGSFGAPARHDTDFEEHEEDRTTNAYFLLLLAALALGSGMAVTVLPADVRGVFLFPCIGLALPGNVFGVGTVMVGLLFR
jgi:hypothetical protein